MSHFDEFLHDRVLGVGEPIANAVAQTEPDGC
jgi:hypothetical protein